MQKKINLQRNLNQIDMQIETLSHTHRVVGEEHAIHYLNSLHAEEADVFFDRAKERHVCYFRKDGAHYQMTRDEEGLYTVKVR